MIEQFLIPFHQKNQMKAHPSSKLFMIVFLNKITKKINFPLSYTRNGMAAVCNNKKKGNRKKIKVSDRTKSMKPHATHVPAITTLLQHLHRTFIPKKDVFLCHTHTHSHTEKNTR